MDHKKDSSRGSHGPRKSHRDNFRGSHDPRKSHSEGFRGHQGPREMHKAVCADCGEECEVPFKPSENRPVYCKECFRKHKKF